MMKNNFCEKTFGIIQSRIVSERSVGKEATQETVTFEVRLKATKEEIARSMEKLFATKVLSVNTSISHGKTKRAAKTVKKRSDWKKAHIKLAKGEVQRLFGEPTNHSGGV